MSNHVPRVIKIKSEAITMLKCIIYYNNLFLRFNIDPFVPSWHEIQKKNSVAVDNGLLFQNHSRRAISSSPLLWNRRRRIVTRRISKLSSSIRV